MKKIFQGFLCLAMIALGVASCGSQNAQPVDASLLYGKTWKVVAIGGKAAQYKEDGANITFDKESRQVAANTGCNIFNAGFTQEDASLIFSDGPLTKMMCLDADLERLFLDAVQKTRAFTVSADTLTLRSSGGESLMTLVPEEK